MAEGTLSQHLRWSAAMAMGNRASIPMAERVQAQMEAGEVGPATRGEIAAIRELHGALHNDYLALGAQLRRLMTVKDAYAATGNEAGGKDYTVRGN